MFPLFSTHFVINKTTTKKQDGDGFDSVGHRRKNIISRLFVSWVVWFLAKDMMADSSVSDSAQQQASFMNKL